MMNLISIIESLKARPRRLTNEENLYLDHLADEMRRAESDAAQWRILQREGLDQIDIEHYGFDTDLLEHVLSLRRESMN